MSLKKLAPWKIQADDRFKLSDIPTRLPASQSQVDEAKWLKSLFAPDAVRTEKDFKRVCTLFTAGGVFDACVDEAFSYARQARDAITLLPPSPIRDIMEQIPNYVVARATEPCVSAAPVENVA